MARVYCEPESTLLLRAAYSPACVQVLCNARVPWKRLKVVRRRRSPLRPRSMHTNNSHESCDASAAALIIRPLSAAMAAPQMEIKKASHSGARTRDLRHASMGFRACFPGSFVYCCIDVHG